LIRAQMQTDRWQMWKTVGVKS